MLRHHLKEFKRLARKTGRKPTAKNVHALRVLSRRWRAHLWLVPKESRSRRAEKALNELKELTRTLGEQRQYDVALEDATRYGFNPKELRRQRKRSRKAVRRALKPSRRRRCFKALKRAAREFDELPASLFPPRLQELKERLDPALAHPPSSDTARHRLRIEAKRARYVLKNFKHDVPPLEQLQDHLGRWHDLATVAPLARKSKRFNRDKKREWTIAERLMRPALARTTRELKTVARELK